MSQEREDELIERARRALDEGVDNLPSEVNARLRAVRRDALSPRRRPGWLLPAGGLALASLAALSLWLTNPLERAAPLNGEALGDLELLSEVEDLELLQELDFYLWLEEEAGDVG